MTLTYTIAQLVPAGSNSGFETVTLSQWDDSFMGLCYSQCDMIYSIRGWHCECTGDYTTERATRNPACVHTAIYRTWRRQGRPGWKIYHLDFYQPVAMYHVDNNGFIWRNKSGVLSKLSKVEQVNQNPLYRGREPGI